MPNTILGARDILVNRTDKFSTLTKLLLWWDLNPGKFYSKVLISFNVTLWNYSHRIENIDMVGEREEALKPYPRKTRSPKIGPSKEKRQLP